MKMSVYQVTLNGIRDIMFDRYAGDNKTSLPTDQKVYLGEDDETLILPSANVISMLSAMNTPSAPKRFMDPRKYKMTAQAILSYTMISPDEIKFTRNGEPIKFGGIGSNGVDPVSGIYTHYSVARLDKGIPNPKVRPVLPLPWSLSFELTYFENDGVSIETIRGFIDKAGIAIGLGTYRGVYGKYILDTWSQVK